jgi:protein-S-isoprenylcysteine O-methyltransferase Ste14
MTRRGPRDVAWFGVQLALFLAMVAAPLIDRRPVPRLVRLAGVALQLLGVGVALAGYRALGSSHSPWSTPAAEARLVNHGIYGQLRHPIYLGWVVSGLGVALLAGSRMGVAVAIAGGIFYDARARDEERQLTQTYAGYADYVSSSSRFLPGVY